MLVLLLLSSLTYLISTAHLSPHYSDALKIKCDALPFRTVFLEQKCYISIDAHFDLEGASRRCSIVFEGSKLVLRAPDAVWSSLFADKSKYLQEDHATGFKKAMCLYESRFSCSTGASTSIPGRCIHKGDKKMTYRQADNFCARIGALPAPQNDLENTDIASANRLPVWLRPAHSKTWSGTTSFSRFGRCVPSPFHNASDPQWCSAAVAAAANPAENSRGYWAMADQTSLLDVLCIGDANNEFWTAPPKTPKVVPETDCKFGHKINEKTGRCTWSGPPEACVQIFNLDNQTEFIRIPEYPKGAPGIDFDYHTINSKAFQPFINKASRAIVRRGCMATFWTNPFSMKIAAENKILRNVEYGDYVLPTKEMGSLDTLPAAHQETNALSRVSCYCDPLETEGERTAKEKCVENHEWSEEKQRCIWTLDDKFAGEIANHEGKKMMLEIPNWPLEKRYDVTLRAAKLTDYEYKVTQIVVRQGCFCTIYSTRDLMATWRPRQTVGYGKHGVASKYAKNPLTRLDMGSMRVVCECMNGDSGKARLIRTSESPECVEMHAYNDKTKRCEWTGPANACMQLTNTRNQKMFLNLANWPSYVAGVHVLYNGALAANWNRQVTWVTVRRGCFATAWVAQQLSSIECAYREYKLLENIEYGTYRVPQKDFGDVEGGFTEMGTNQINCVCDAAYMALTPAPPTTPCLPGHVYDSQTGQCEWTRDKAICGVIRNEKGQTMDLVIPNWPLEKRFTWNMKVAAMTGRQPISKIFFDRVVSVLVRQHCFFTGYQYSPNAGDHTLRTAGYGNHTVKSTYNKLATKGTTRIVCECLL